MATTRSPEVARHIAQTSEDAVELREFGPQPAVQLLQQLSGLAPGGMSEVLSVMADELGRLPLALNVAGRLLRDERDRPNGLGPRGVLDAIRRGGIYARELLDERRDATGAEELSPTVGALLGISVARLSDECRRCFAATGVFASNASFTLEALGAVWAVRDAASVAQALCDIGLMRCDRDSKRLDLHAVLCGYAYLLLREDETGVALREACARHARYYAQVFRKASDLCGTVYDVVLPTALDEGLRLFDSDRANIGVAQQWALEAAGRGDEGAAEACACMATVPSRLPALRQSPEERVAWLSSLLSALPETPDYGFARGITLEALCLAYQNVQDDAAALTASHAATAAHKHFGDERRAAVARRLGADTLSIQRRPRKALPVFRNVIATLNGCGDARQEGIAWHNCGIAYLRLGQPEDAVKCFRERMKIAERSGDPSAKVASLHALASCRSATGDVQGAITDLKCARDLCCDGGWAFQESELRRILCDLAELQLVNGDEEEARETLSRALRVCGKLSESRIEFRWDRGVGEDAVQMAVICNKLGRYGVALRYATECIGLADRMNHMWLLAGALLQRGLAHQFLNHWRKAKEDLKRASELYHGLRGRNALNWRATAAHFAGLLAKACYRRHRRHADLEEAREWFTQEVTLWGDLLDTQSAPEEEAATVAAVLPPSHIAAGAAHDPATRLALETPCALARARAQAALSRVCRALGDVRDADAYAEQATGYFGSHGHGQDLAQLNEEMHSAADPGTGS
jgi:tetratricopeptide (TPR) repeat protein